MQMRYKFSAAILMLCLCLVGCSSDSYDAGEGKYSLLVADMGMAHTVAKGEVDAFILDDGQALSLNPHATVSWCEKADSLYRALCYYYLDDADVEPYAIVRVPVLRLSDDDDEVAYPSDPVILHSVWVSKDKKWVNLRLSVKTGKVDDENAVQAIGVERETVTEDSITLRLLHDQGGVPEYYSSEVYASIPVSDEMKGKTLVLDINTYDGLKTFELKID